MLHMYRLKSDYEEVRGGMLSRTDLMQDFQNFCARFGHTSGYTLMQLLRLVKYVRICIVADCLGIEEVGRD